MFDAIVVLLIAFFLEETYVYLSVRPLAHAKLPISATFTFSMYDRHLANPNPCAKPHTLHYRVETLLGVTGFQMARFRPSWKAVVLAPFKVVWRPHLFTILWYEGVMFGFQIGFHVCAG